MSVAQGFTAGMQIGGRFGGIGNALKSVLTGLQQQGQYSSDTNMQMMKGMQATNLQMMDDAGALKRSMLGDEALMERTRYAQGEANKRAMIAEGYILNEAGDIVPGDTELPENMREAGYALYKGKPYKTRSIVDEMPGEREAMEIAYLNYIYDQIKDTDRATASQIKTQIESRKRSIGASMLGMDPYAVGSPGEDTWWNKMKNTAVTAGENMLGFFRE